MVLPPMSAGAGLSQHVGSTCSTRWANSASSTRARAVSLAQQVGEALRANASSSRRVDSACSSQTSWYPRRETDQRLIRSHPVSACLSSRPTSGTKNSHRSGGTSDENERAARADR